MFVEKIKPLGAITKFYQLKDVLCDETIKKLSRSLIVTYLTYERSIQLCELDHYITIYITLDAFLFHLRW